MRLHRNGFTLIELIVVFAMIGILAAIVVTSFADAHTEATIAATGEDILAISKALEHHNTNYGYWPAETTVGSLPPEIKAQFKGEDPFAKACPIGSVYDYDHQVAGDGRRIISISIKSSLNMPAPTIVDALELDAYLDDGVLNSGRFRSVLHGYSYRVSE